MVDNKAGRWVPQGVAFVSVNYPMLPDSPPLEQARDVARALATVQRQAASWGADAHRMVLMGHSAGAHLAALITAHPQLAAEQGVQPWLGTVCLDSAAFDVVAMMSSPHYRLYDRAFGADRSTWMAASPLHQIAHPTVPLMAVCSTRRTEACAQARAFAAAWPTAAPPVRILPVDLSHRDINATLGQTSDYTAAVEAFMQGLPGWPPSRGLNAAPRRR